MNVFDIGVILLIIMSGLVGLKKGAIKGAISIIGTIIVFYLGFTFSKELSNILSTYLPFSNFWGSFEGIDSLNILMYRLVGFLLVFGGLYFVFSIILAITGILQKLVDMTIILQIPSKIIGFLIGLVEGYIVIFVVLLLLAIPLGNIDLYRESKVIDYIIHDSLFLSDKTNKVIEPIDEVYELTNNIQDEKITNIEADNQLMDMLLKYEITNVETVKVLEEKEKLDNVSNLDNILKKYE